MAGPEPYQPIRYPEDQSLFFAGQQTIGTAHKFQIDANFPTQYASAKNKDFQNFWVGAAIARHPSGTGFVLASAAGPASAAIGLACLGAPINKPEVVQLYGLFTMDNWTPVTNTVDLVPLGNYYLSGFSGQLTTIPPVGPAIAQLVGIAISPRTMEIVAGGGLGTALVGTGSDTLGMSNLGNTLGTTGVVTGSAVEMIFAGGNNITLSQSLNGLSGTITIQGAAGSDIAGIQTLGISNLGHTSGTSGVATGSAVEFILVGGNNVTLSQSINGNAGTVTISAFNQTVQTQNLFDLTLSGNTSGALALVSSGTLTLAGGNNITLSQAGNAITISGPNTVSQSVQTQNCVDLSLSGNTSGALALISSGTAILAGGNNVTLSQNGQSITISAGTPNNTFAHNGLAQITGSHVSLVFEEAGALTINDTQAGGSMTMQFSVASQTAQTQNLFDLTLSGNTSGTLALVSSGTLTLAGGNNITLSQSGNAVTISGPNTSSQSVQTQNCVDVSLSGNTSGTLALISSGTAILAGGNNITLSQNGQSITISAANSAAQTVQTQNLFDLTLSGNTSGTLALVSSGTLTLAGGNNITLSQNGNAITISGATSASQTVQTQNCVDLSLSGNTTGTLALISSGTAILAGGNNITLSQNGQSVTISAFNQTVQTQNLIDVTAAGNTTGTLALVSSGTLTLAGGNNVTLSQVGNAITISGPNTAAQTVQTQNCVDLSLSGNTSGTLALISSGTAILAGGNNITLSQNGQSVTISAFTQTVQTQGFLNSISIIGNTSGTTSAGTGSLVLAGGNNITLSASTAAGGITVTISAANQTVESQSMGMSNIGNTSGTTGIASGGQVRFVFAGGNNITLSQSLNGASGTITISAPNAIAQSVQTQNCVDLSLSGNTSGTLTLISSGTAILAGGNNITLSQNGQSVTISAFNQSVQTQNCVDLSLSGNTSGTLTLISSGTGILAGGNNITLSQNGQSVTISAFNQSVQTQNALDVTLAGNTTGTLALISSGTMTLAGGSNITLSQNGNAVTVSAGLVRSYWHNIDVPGIIPLTSAMGSIFFGPLQRDAYPFDGNMTVSTMYMGVGMSASTAAMSAAQTFSVSYGLYTLNGATLSLVNSVSTSFGWAAATNASTNFAGYRMLSFHSSQWSSSPVMSFQKYWHAFGWSNQNTLATNWTINQLGTNAGGFVSIGALNAVFMSGTIGVSQVADAASTKGFIFGYGIISSTALPASIQNSQISKSNITQYGITPFVMFNNITSNF